MIYPLAADTLGDEEIDAAKTVLDSRRLTMGEHVAAFEREFAAYVGAKHAVMVNSGSSANLIMVDVMLRRAKGRGLLGPGDEVFVPALAWPTTVWPIVQLGLVPVFVDVNPQTLAIDLESAKRSLDSRVRAMFLIHVLGRMPEMCFVLDFCDKYKLHLLEDACESLGANGPIDNKRRFAGTIGLMGSYSLYFSHHLSAIEGGVVVTDDSELVDDLRSARAHGWTRDRSDRDAWKRAFEGDDRFLFVTSGYNVRPTEIQAAIARVQLRRLPDMIAARKALAQRVYDCIQDRVPWLQLIGAECLNSEARAHSWMMLPFRVNNYAFMNATEAQRRLQQRGIDTRPIIAGNFTRHPAASKLGTYRTDYPLRVADDIFNNGFMIGCHPTATPETVDALLRALDSLCT